MISGRWHENTQSTYHLPATIPSTWLPHLCYRKMAFGSCVIQPLLPGRRQHLLWRDASVRIEWALFPHLNHYDSTGVYGQETKFIGEEFSSKMYADAAIRFLQKQKDEKQPFLAYVAFTSPHDPRNQLPDYGQNIIPTR